VGYQHVSREKFLDQYLSSWVPLRYSTLEYCRQTVVFLLVIGDVQISVRFVLVELNAWNLRLNKFIDIYSVSLKIQLQRAAKLKTLSAWADTNMDTKVP
jgi:hypothetical protein